MPSARGRVFGTCLAVGLCTAWSLADGGVSALVGGMLTGLASDDARKGLQRLASTTVLGLQAWWINRRVARD